MKARIIRTKEEAMKEHIIETNCGKVKGYQEGNVHIYRGIPYARTERFEPPKPWRWEGIFDATQGERDCYQYSSFLDESKREDPFYYEEFRKDMEFSYDENFMTLNVVAPADAENLPVLLFIHGGGFETGTVGEPPYGLCTEYAKRGIVYVSVGYRLNVFAMYGGENFGLQDQAAAVRWAYENIAAFGGDPNRITLMGQSAGAMSVTDLLYSDLLKGMVQGVILMSGGGPIPKIAGPWTKKQAKPFWDQVRAQAGAADEEALKTVDPERLWRAWYEVRSKWAGFQAAQPAIDGTVIPDVPQNVLRQRKELDVPVMVGVTSQDFLPVILYEVALRWGLDNAKKHKQPVYGYFFDRALPGNRFKAFHACDLWYMFGSMEKSWRPFEETDFGLAAEMMDCAANFVKKQNPNGPGLCEWQPLSRKQKKFRLFDGENAVMIGPWKCRKKVWNTMLRDKGPM